MDTLLKEFLRAVLWVVCIGYALVFLTLCSVQVAKADERFAHIEKGRK